MFFREAKVDDEKDILPMTTSSIGFKKPLDFMEAA